MSLIHHDGDDDSDVVFRDLIMLMLSGFVTVAVLLLAHIHPSGAKAAQGQEPPGNVIVEVRWPDRSAADIDLWVKGPGDVPVGYSNKGGKLFNLLRDDLGQRADATDLNYEVAYSRGIVAGEYTVNLQLYRGLDATLPLTATVVASVRPKPNESARQLVTTRVALGREGQELTAFRFRLDEDGNLVPGSVNSLFRELRSGSPA